MKISLCPDTTLSRSPFLRRNGESEDFSLVFSELSWNGKELVILKLNSPWAIHIFYLDNSGYKIFKSLKDWEEL